MEKKLERLPHEGAISGVCAGVAEYLNVDKGWVRIAFIASVFFSSAIGIGLLGPIIYVVLWVALPVRNPRFFEKPFNPYEVDYTVKTPFNAESPKPEQESFRSPHSIQNENNPYHPDFIEKEPVKSTPFTNDQKTAGFFLIAFGLIILAYQLDWIVLSDLRIFWPALLIVIGLYLMYTAFYHKNPTVSEQRFTPEKDVEPTPEVKDEIEEEKKASQDNS